MRYNIIFCRTLENHSVQKAPHNLINSLEDGTLTDNKVKRAERFICKLYKVPDSVDAADEKVCTFQEGNQSWSLTTNEWCTKIPHFRSTQSGTDIEDGVHPKPHYTCTKSVWMEEGAEFYDTNFRISEDCLELVSYQCQKGCQTMWCKCRKTRLQGTGACKCSDLQEDSPCINQNWMHYKQWMYSSLRCLQYFVLKSLVGYEIEKMWDVIQMNLRYNLQN